MSINTEGDMDDMIIKFIHNRVNEYAILEEYMCEGETLTIMYTMPLGGNGKDYSETKTMTITCWDMLAYLTERLTEYFPL